MFGREYGNNLDLLTSSFEEMNKLYRKKTKTVRKNVVLETIKKIYILIFGIPEIGFQIRSIYFSSIISSYVLKKGPKNILDAGCGIGVYTFWLGKKFKNANILGGDINKQKLESCKILANNLLAKNVSYAYFDITKTSKVTTYDLIINIDVLEHIDNYKLALKNLSKLLKKNGYLYIHVPQPNQQRILPTFKNWHHDYHAHEGISKINLENHLEKLGFKIIISRETFGFFGKLAWEFNHLFLSRSFFMTGLTYPFLYLIARIDAWHYNRNGLGIAVLARRS